MQLHNHDTSLPPGKSSPVVTVFLAVAAIVWLAMAYGLILVFNRWPILGVPLFLVFMWLSFGDNE
jgi:hypothetical protein